MTDSAPEAVIEAMARAMWNAYADEPLQVGKFKEPTDYREFHHLSEEARAQICAWVRAALSAASRAGFVLVPVEATEEMVEAMRAIFVDSRAGGWRDIYWRDIYAAALAARPGAAPTKQEE